MVRGFHRKRRALGLSPLDVGFYSGSKSLFRRAIHAAPCAFKFAGPCGHGLALLQGSGQRLDINLG